MAYRHSRFSDRPDGCGAGCGSWRLTPGRSGGHPGPDGRADAAKRKASQPLEWPSAGSTFKRPEGYFAGDADRSVRPQGTDGGRRPGVSEKHAGFVINRGGATCADVLALIGQVQETVYWEHRRPRWSRRSGCVGIDSVRKRAR
ncbi:MAG: hypothetical protein ACLSHM_01425 [Vescimonas sp.]